MLPKDVVKQRIYQTHAWWTVRTQPCLFRRVKSIDLMAPGFKRSNGYALTA